MRLGSYSRLPLCDDLASKHRVLAAFEAASRVPLVLQAQAFATAIAEAYGPECDCEVAGRLDAEEVATVIAEASASSLAEVCVGADSRLFPET